MSFEINTFLIAQLIGVIGLGLSILAMQMKERRTIMKVDLFIGIAWIGNYALMGGLNGAIMNCVGTLRTLMALYIPQRFFIITYLFILTLIWGCGLYFATNATEILPCLGMTLFTTAFFLCHERPLMVRVMLAGSAVWLTYACLIGTIFPIISILMAATSTVIGMARHEGWFKPTQTAFTPAE